MVKRNLNENRMPRWLGSVLTCALAACGAPTVMPPAPIAEPGPVKPHAAYTIMPGELGDPGIVDRIPHRCRVVRRGPVWLGDASEPTSSGSVEPLVYRPVVPVLGETRARVRVVSTDDDARLTLWIDRGDLAPTIVAPVELADARGRRDPAAGVWFEPGADVDVARGTRGLDEVTLRDRAIKVVGWAPSAAIGGVWVGPAPVAPDEHAPWQEALTPIRIAPRVDAAVLATTIEAVAVTKLATRDGWVELEARRAGARIHGFSRAGDVVDERIGELGQGAGHGHGYGMSNTDHIEVPAGACLYDRQAGDVIGVNLATRTRYANTPSDSDWAFAYVDTEWWGLVTVALHVAARRPDGAIAAWDSCDAR